MACWDTYYTNEGPRRCMSDESECPDCRISTLESELSDLRQLQAAVLEALPGVYYMDLPDGGDLPLGEQVKRMARDAKAWRRWSSYRMQLARHVAADKLIESLRPST